MSEIFWHIGYTKAASTYLQTWFGSCEEIHFENFRPTWRKLVTVSDIAFKGQEIRDWLADTKQQATTKSIIISHERLAGSPHSGHYDQLTIAKRIKEIAPNSKIILIVREQKELFSSIYRQYLRAGGILLSDQYFSEFWDGRIPRFNFAPYYYDRVLEIYQSIFGMDGVFVFDFNLLKHSENDFQNAIINKTGLKLGSKNIGQTNCGIPINELAEIWIENNFKKHHTNSLGGAKSLLNDLPEEFKLKLKRYLATNYCDDVDANINSIVANRFMDSNFNFRELTGIDFSSSELDNV